MTGIILENVFQLTPCILCVIQRGIFSIYFLFFSLIFYFKKKTLAMYFKNTDLPWHYAWLNNCR